MRIMLDTCVLIELITESGRLSRDVEAMLYDYDNILCVSIESLKELVVLYNRKGFGRKIWKTSEIMIHDIIDTFDIEPLPLRLEHVITYSNLVINEAEDHHDPSDHIIISHAITNKMTLVSSGRKFPFYRTQGLDLVYNEL